MIRRRHAILLALGLLAPLALVDSPAGAALEQDLVASVTAGTPGTVITLSSATCVPPTETSEATLDVSLYVGTAPNQKIAANGYSGNGATTLTVPDWVDASEPAVIEGSCYQTTLQGGEDSIEYDPIAFDIEPGAGTPTQVRTFSRTELLAGQGFEVTGSCGPDQGNGFVAAIVQSGTDQTGRGDGSYAGSGSTRTDADGSFDFPVIVSNAEVWLESSSDGGPTQVDVSELPMDVAPGDFTSLIYCANDDETIQFLEPQALTVTGVAPTDRIDLTNVAGTRDAVLDGACDAGEVTGGFQAISKDELLDEFDAPDPAAARAGLLADAPQELSRRIAGHPVINGAVRSTTGSARALDDEGFSEFAATPGADGSWQATDTVGFDEGIVIALAVCGDPLADGYAYDPQGVETTAPVAPPTVPTTVPTPAPAPANAVSGTPTYAG